MSNRIIFFIDGFNVYHSLLDLGNVKYKWIDYSKLAQCYIKENEEIKDIYYFTSLCPWDPKRQKSYKIYRIEVLLRYHEEKQTDVNIAVLLMKLAFEDKYDTAIIISGDTDFSLAIVEIKNLFPRKRRRQARRQATKV